MKDVIIQLVTAFLGSLGFTLLFGLRRRYLFAASLGGGLAWGVYLAVEAWMKQGLLAGLIAAAFAGL